MFERKSTLLLKWIMASFLFGLGCAPKALGQRMPLYQALQALENYHDVQFAYDPGHIDNQTWVSLPAERQTLRTELKQLLSPLGIEFELIHQRYVALRSTGNKEPAPAPRYIPKRLVCGSITDSISGRPLAYASVWIQEKMIGVQTDSTGAFRFWAPKGTVDTLLIRYIGYRNLKIPLRAFRRGCPEIALAWDLQHFPEVLVQDRPDRQLQFGQSGGRVAITETLPPLNSLGDKDILRTIQLLPGISTNDESATNLYIRGGTPDQNLLLWDGIPIYRAGHFFGMFSAFPTQLTDQVQVFRGNYPAQYGGRVAGVIDMSIKPVQSDSLEAAAGMNMVYAHAYVHQPLAEGKWSILMGGRRSFSDFLESPTYQHIFGQIARRGKIEENQKNKPEELDFQRSPELRFYDWNTKVVYRPSDQHQISLTHYRGGDRLDYSARHDQFFLLDTHDFLMQKSRGTSFKWQANWNEQWQTVLLAVATKYESLYELEESYREFESPETFFTELALNNNLQDWQIQGTARWRPNPNHTFEMGLTRQHLHAGFGVHFLESDRSQEQFQEQLKGYNFNGFLNYQLDLPDLFRLNIGWRTTRYRSFDPLFWEPRLNLEVRLPRTPLWFRFGMGQYVQFASQIVENNELGLGEEIWIVTDRHAHTPYITSRQYTAGLQYRQGLWTVDLEAYLKRIANLTTLNLRFRDVDQNPYTEGNGIAEGVDFLLQGQWPAHRAWLTYSLSRVQYRFPALNNYDFFPAAHDQRHRLGLHYAYRRRNWSWSGSWQYASPRPFTPAAGYTANWTMTATGEYDLVSVFVDFTDHNSGMLPAYHRLDIQADYHFPWLQGEATIGVAIFNVYNQQNIFDQRYFVDPPGAPGEQGRLLATDLNMLPLTPNLSFSLSW